MSAHIHWRRRLSSLSSQGGAIRRHTRTRIGLHSPLITLPANQRREVSAAVSQSRYYNIPARKNGLSISGAGEQPVTCLNAHYFLGTPPLLVEVRTHSARHTISIWWEDNLSPGETLPTMGWEDAETHTTKHLGIVARSREGGEGRTGSEARASHVPGRDAEGQICRGRKQAAMAALTAPARSDRKPGPADSLGAPLPSSRTEAKSVLDREPWQPGTTSSPGTLLFLLASAASFGRGARHRPQEDARPTSCLSLSLSLMATLSGQLPGQASLSGTVGRASLATFPCHGSTSVTALEGGRVHLPSRGRVAAIMAGWRQDRRHREWRPPSLPTATHSRWHQFLPRVIWTQLMGARWCPGLAQADSVPTGHVGKLRARGTTPPKTSLPRKAPLSSGYLGWRWGIGA